MAIIRKSWSSEIVIQENWLKMHIKGALGMVIVMKIAFSHMKLSSSLNDDFLVVTQFRKLCRLSISLYATNINEVNNVRWMNIFPFVAQMDKESPINLFDIASYFSHLNIFQRVLFASFTPFPDSLVLGWMTCWWLIWRREWLLCHFYPFLQGENVFILFFHHSLFTYTSTISTDTVSMRSKVRKE